MALTQGLTLVAAAGAAVAALGYLGRVFWRSVMALVKITHRMLQVADVILGSEEHTPLPTRLDSIEHELRTNNGSSLRDVADRVEDVATALRLDTQANAMESKARREQDREVIDRLAARVDAIWQHQGPHDRRAATPSPADPTSEGSP